MKKTFMTCLMALTLLSANAVQTSEKLNRAPVAVATKTGNLVSWRYLKSDGNATFSVYRNGTLLKSGIADVTNYLDADGKAGDTYKVVSTNGDEATTTAWESIYKKISIPRPNARKDKNGTTTGRYRPDDISVGDVDGDGDYELIVKWFPDNQRDSGKEGCASATYVDCYEMDGTQKWRIDIGDGIRSGNHTMQFLVYDFDGDGKAEMICKTTVDTKDGKGNYVTMAGDATIKALDNTAVTLNKNGRVTKGAELLTVFNGETGAAMHTIWYSPNRNMEDFPHAESLTVNSAWNDTNYNRCERYNACVAYLDGLDNLPTAIMQRGYYSRCYLWAVDWNGTELKTRWLHKGTSASQWSLVDANGTVLANETTDPVASQGKSSYGQGVHGISVGDVDEDGKDEIVIGSATIGNDGKLMCSTGFGHGDAIHLGKLVAGRPGMQVMMPHEEKSNFGNYGYDVHDAATGEILANAIGEADNGRGLACDFIPENPGWEFWSSFDSNTRNCADNTVVMAKKADTNFRIYWTGDPYDQSFDGRYDATANKCAPRIRAYNTASKTITGFFEFTYYGNPQTCNTTKATPCLQADLMGDWREELIMTGYEADWKSPTCDLLIYSTPEPTKFKVPCLMEDHTYRMGIAWQNSSYNQPPHLGYDLPAYLGIDGATYQTNMVSNAPEGVIPPAPTNGEETIKVASTDRDPVKGTSFTTAANMVTAQTSGSYVKFRTGENGNKWNFTVNQGYVITGFKVEGYSNNTTASAGITATSVTVDGDEKLSAPHVFKPNKVASIIDLGNIKAQHEIVFTFDNSNINSVAGSKNKQILAIITVTYEMVSAIDGVKAKDEASKTATMKVFSDGKIVIMKNGKTYNTAGQLIK